MEKQMENDMETGTIESFIVETPPGICYYKSQALSPSNPISGPS